VVSVNNSVTKFPTIVIPEENRNYEYRFSLRGNPEYSQRLFFLTTTTVITWIIEELKFVR